MKHTETIPVLNQLIEISKDGQYGFEFCASHAEADTLRQVFEERAREFEAGVSALQSLVLEYGGKPVLHGTAIGAVHRGWVRIKDTLGGTNDPDLLEECERGEVQTLKRLRMVATEERLPDTVRATVTRHADAAQRCIDQLRRLRSEMRATA